MTKEIIICSAILVTQDGLIIRGHRHADCYHNLSQRKTRYPNKVICFDGFITSTNRFLGRKEARKIQEDAGIASVSEGGYRGNILYSEDLY